MSILKQFAILQLNYYNIRMKSYRSIALSEKDYARIEATKRLFEQDFSRKVTWNEFILALATGYVMGRAILLNEDRAVMELVDS